MSKLTMYTCKRCDYSTKAKGNLIRHYQRKQKCIVTKEDICTNILLSEITNIAHEDTAHYTCNVCNIHLHSRATYYRHKKKCKAIQESAVVTQLQKEVNELKDQMKAINTSVAKAASYNTTNNIQNAQNITNITINAIGREDISYITQHTKFTDFMVRCIRDKMDGVCNYLVKKHFHPDHPENHNIKKLNKKDDFMECFDGRKWKIRYVEDILEDTFLNIQKDFAAFIDEAINEEGIIKKIWLDNFMKSVGAPLDWDFSNDLYEFDNDAIDEETKTKLRDRIHRLACEYIYRQSKERHA